MENNPETSPTNQEFSNSPETQGKTSSTSKKPELELPAGVSEHDLKKRSEMLREEGDEDEVYIHEQTGEEYRAPQEPEPVPEFPKHIFENGRELIVEEDPSSKVTIDGQTITSGLVIKTLEGEVVRRISSSGGAEPPEEPEEEADVLGRVTPEQMDRLERGETMEEVFGERTARSIREAQSRMGRMRQNQGRRHDISDLEQLEEVVKEAPFYGNRTMYEFKEAIDRAASWNLAKQYIETRLEQLIHGEELDIDRDFTQQAVSEWVAIIRDLVTAEDPDFAKILIDRVYARFYLHHFQILAKYEGGEELGKNITNYLPHYLDDLQYKTKGVWFAMKAIEAPDSQGNKGAYFRLSEGDMNEWKIKEKIELIKSDENLGTYSRDRKFVRLPSGDMTEIKIDKVTEEFNKGGFREHEFSDLELAVALQEGSRKLRTMMVSGVNDQDRNAAIGEVGELTTGDMLLKYIDGESVRYMKIPRDRARRLYQLVYQSEIAFDVAVKLAHILGFSALADGAREKSTGDYMAPEEIILEVPAGAAYDKYTDNQGVERSVPKGVTTGKERINLSIPFAQLSPTDQAILEGVRVRGVNFIAKAQLKAWREFIDKNFDNIDYFTSLSSGDGEREMRQDMFPQIMLGRFGGRDKGYMPLKRKAAALTLSAPQFLGYESMTDVVENWGPRFNNVRSWAKDLIIGHQVKDSYTEKGSKLYADPNAINDPTLKPEKEMRDSMYGFIAEEIARDHMRFVINAIAEFRQKFNKEYADRPNADLDELNDMYNKSEVERLVDIKEGREDKGKFLGPQWWVDVRILWKSLKFGMALWEFIKGIATAAVKQ